MPARFDVAGEFFGLESQPFVASQPFDRPSLRSDHEPGTRIQRNAFRGPLLERGDERVVRDLFGGSDIAHVDSIRQTASIARCASSAIASEIGYCFDVNCA